jgi:hypothetical protein
VASLIWLDEHIRIPTPSYFMPICDTEWPAYTHRFEHLVMIGWATPRPHGWDSLACGDRPLRAVNGSAGMIARGHHRCLWHVCSDRSGRPSTVIAAAYALHSLGNVWKLMDYSRQKWIRGTAEREG